MSTTNVTQFTADIEAFVAKLGVQRKLVVQKIALDLWTGITEMTPVDTGRARANWMLSVGTPSTQVVHEDAKGKGSVPKPSPPTGELSAITGDESVYIINNLPYIEALENGHSKKQAPNGMVRLTMQRVMAQVQKGLGTYVEPT